MTIFAPQILVRRPPLVVGGGATTTLNPSDLLNSTLSGGNLIMTNPSGGTYGGSRSIASYSAGKKFVSYVPTIATNSNDHLLGVAMASHGLISGPDATSAGWFSGSSGTIDGNGGALISGMPSTLIGDVIDMAVDIPNMRLWMRQNGGLWNGSGAADPVGNVGGANISYMTAPLFVWVLGDNSGVDTVNFGATAYTYAAPSGYTNW